MFPEKGEEPELFTSNTLFMPHRALRFCELDYVS